MSRPADKDFTSEHERHNEDVAAYVLGALDDCELTAFETHLNRCVVCRDDVASLQPVIDRIPLTAPQVRAPRALKRAIMREVESELRERDQASEAERRKRAARRRSGGWRLALAGSAALALAVGAVSGLEHSGASPAVRVIHAKVLGVPGSGMLRLGGGRAELVVRGMAPPALDRVYEVWLKRPGQALEPTTALFNVTSKGSGSVDVPGDLHGVTQVMVTPEPLGGSLAPTHAPVLVATL